MSITREDFTFPSSDGIHEIHCFAIFPESPKAILQIEHGIAEHIERYVPFAEKMAAAGYAVFADDHLGHGKTVKSEDELCWFAEKDGWQLVCDDVIRLHDEAKKKFPDIPFALMGHSMGSFMVRTVAIDHSDLLDALVISGTGNQKPAIIAAGRLAAKEEKARLGSSKAKSKLIDSLAFGAYNKPFAPNRAPFDWLSRDEAEVDKYVADPLCGNIASVGLFLDMLSGLSRIRRSANIANIRKDLPIYMMSGACDPVGDMGKGVKETCELYRENGINNVTVKLYPNGRHELLNGPDRETVISDLTDWLDKTVGETAL